MKRRSIYFLFFFLNLLGFGVLLVHGTYQFHGDWSSYFEPLSLSTRSSIWSYGQFPLHNPWRCGGSDLLTNPQTRIFSPLGLLDVFLPPQWACITSLILFGFLGLVSHFELLRLLGLSTATAIVGSILFVNSSWFALHFAEGHITYGEMQLLPLIFYCGMRYSEKKIQLLLTSVLALLLLDGAIQAFVFSGMVLVCAIWVRIQKSKALTFRSAWWELDIRFLLKLGVLFFLVTSVKTIPVLITIGDRQPMFDQTTMSAQLLFKTLFYPFQMVRMPAITDGFPYFFHEFGCYLGWVATGLFLTFLFSKRDRMKERPFLVLFFFWYWIGSGLGHRINPWTLFQKIPIVNQAHIQSRTFIIMFLFFVIVVAFALERYRARRTLWLALSLILVAESSFVRFHSYSSLLDESSPGMTANDLIRSNTLLETVDDGSEVAHYFTPNRGCYACNDRALMKTKVLPRSNPQQHGEIYLEEGKGEVAFEKYTPGEINVRYETQSPAVIAINTNYLWGWKAIPRNVEIVSKGFGDLVRLRIPQGAGVVSLSYQPVYFGPCLFLFLMGCIGFLIEVRALWVPRSLKFA